MKKRIQVKLIPKLNKKKFDIDSVDYINEDQPDCYLTFEIKNSITTISLDWADDFDVDELISLFEVMGKGEILEPIFQILATEREADEFEYMKETLTQRLLEYREKQKKESNPDEDDDEPPIIEPLNTYNHILNVNAPGNGE